MTTLVLKQVELSIAAQRLLGPLDVTVAPGQIAAVMGPSGAGKSSLLAYLCGVLPKAFSARGCVLLGDHDLTPLPPEKRRLGILFQDDLLFPHLSVAVAILLLGGLATILAGFWFTRLRSAPPIHDITTDLDDPPVFQDIARIRKAAGAVNTVEYQRTQRVRGRDINVSEAQRRAYPDVQPLILPQMPARALQLAEQAAQAMGWEIVATVRTVVPVEGRIEATDSTWYFGFEDDVVIRVRPDPNGSRVDVRSVSRVGLGDVGTNARRVREYTSHLRRLAELQ